MFTEKLLDNDLNIDQKNIKQTITILNIHMVIFEKNTGNRDDCLYLHLKLGNYLIKFLLAPPF